MQKVPPEAALEDNEDEMYDDVSMIKSAQTTADGDDNEILYEAEPMYHVRFFILNCLFH